MAFLQRFIGLKSTQKWQRNRKLKSEVFIVTSVPVYMAAFFTICLNIGLFNSLIIQKCG